MLISCIPCSGVMENPKSLKCKRLGIGRVVGCFVGLVVDLAPSTQHNATSAAM